MARITVEDCVDKVANRFDLVLLAAHRARALSKGAAITIEQDNDKPAAGRVIHQGRELTRKPEPR